MIFTVLDAEANGLLDKVTKMHCLCYTQLDENLQEIKSGVIFTADELQSLIDESDYIVCHNILGYDKPLFKKLFNIELNNSKIIDTLGVSYYLFPHFDKHGLAFWGQRVGISKPEIDDWSEKSQEEYIHRCAEDVKINVSIFIGMFSYLKDLYENNLEDVFEIIGYLNFKMDCLREHDVFRIPLNVELCEKHLADLQPIFEQNTAELAAVMPIDKAKILKQRPKNMFKQDGTLSVLGLKWLEYLKENNLPGDTIIHREDPNPGSDVQLKSWLFSLGWKPITFKISKSKSNKGAKIPQVNLPFGGGLCQSVKDLYEVEPNLQLLEMYYKIRHRIGIFKSYLDNKDENNMVKCRAHGLTNTLRLTHSKPIVNLPKPGVFYGTECREVLTIPNTEEYVMIGADISGLEDNTKQHYIYFYDPEYVREMRVPGFDAHIDIGVLAGFITKEEEQFFKDMEDRAKKEIPLTDEEKDRLKPIKKKRGTAKSTNFCLPIDNTEVLTKTGWKFYRDLRVGEEVFSFENNALVLTPIKDIFFYPGKEVTEMKNKWFSFESTENHRWLVDKRVRTKNNPVVNRKYVETKDIVSDCNIIRSAPYLNKKTTIGVTNARVLGWLLSDGHLEYKGGISCSISQKKYIEELERDLSLCNLKVRKDTSREDGVVIFEIKAKSARDFLKSCNLPENVSKHNIDYTELIINMSFEERQNFLHTFWLADGGWHGKSKAYYQNRGKILDAVLLSLTLNGFNYTINSNGTYKNFENVNVYVSNRNHTTGQKLKKEFSRITDVFCISTEKSNFIAKQGDIVSITGNSATYGAGGPKIAETAKVSLEEGIALHEIYWKRNWAVKKIAEDCIVKTVRNQKWLYNPLSGFWLYLKEEKDRFSTLNQNSGVYVFDNWLRIFRKKVNPLGIGVSLQYHDELLLWFKKEHTPFIRQSLRESIQEVNNLLKLNIEIDISIDEGTNYAECH